MSRPILAFLAFLPVLCSLAKADETWPQWRGPRRDGTFEGRWPKAVDANHLKRRWAVELGPSYSGPLVTPDHVFVTETSDGRDETVRALERSTGREAWKVTWKGAMEVPFFARKNGSWIRSTPAYDDGKLYVGGIRDVLVCLDAATGQEVWRVDFVSRDETPLPTFGFVCSPLVHGDAVYVQAGGGFSKLDKRTGKTLWRTLMDGGGMSGSAFSSPLMGVVDGVPQVIVQTRRVLAGVSPKSGTILWSVEVPAFRGMNILTPTLSGNRIFTSSYGGGSVVFDVVHAVDAFQVSEGWKDPVQGYMSSPVLLDGHLYMHLRNKRMTCIDLATGVRKWTSSERFGEYMSLVTDGKKILALDERGVLLLIDADPRAFSLLGRHRVSESSTWAHLAIAGNDVVVRSLDGVAVFRWEDDSAGASLQGD